MLTKGEGEKLYGDMMAADNYCERINPRHIKPSLTIEQIKMMTGPPGQDGEFSLLFFTTLRILSLGPYFAEWVSCLITENDLASTKLAAPTIQLAINSTTFPSVRDHINECCNKYNRQEFKLSKHHVVLRAKEDDIPLLSTKNNGMTGKRKCFYTIHLLFLSFSITLVRHKELHIKRSCRVGGLQDEQ